jgi:hypothetical protein
VRRKRAASGRTAFHFGPRNTPQEANFTFTQKTRPPSDDSPRPANEEFPLVLAAARRDMTFVE